MTKRNKTRWTVDFRDYAIRRITRFNVVGWYGRPKDEYDVSFSEKHTSWYVGFESVEAAIRFAEANLKT